MLVATMTIAESYNSYIILDIQSTITETCCLSNFSISRFYLEIHEGW